MHFKNELMKWSDGNKCVQGKSETLEYKRIIPLLGTCKSMHKCHALLEPDLETKLG